MEKTLNELIDELCPDGVEYKTLQDLLKTVSQNGKKIQTKKALPSGEFPVVDQGAKGIQGFSNNRDNVIFSETPIIAYGDHTTIVKYLDFPFVVGGDGLKTFTVVEGNLPKYVYYLISLFNVPQDGYKRHFIKLRDVQVPVPPLPVQEEIVHILDTMSTLTATLTAEKEARKKQYAYYRDVLLTFGEDVEVEYKTLGEICSIQTGKLNANSAVQNGKYEFFTCSKEVLKTDTYKWDTEAVLISGNGDLSVSHYFNGKFDAYQRTYVLSEFSVLPKFAYYCIRNRFYTHAMNNVKKGSVPYITLPTVKKFIIPVPPLRIQEEIVSILDKLSDLAEGVDIGLPREIELAQKQYDYYLAKLLDFPEA